jgi:two-component sensor histidine kinase/CHASE1-domain containing sensor protein
MMEFQPTDMAKPNEKSLPAAILRTPAAILVLLALGGSLLSAFAARREALQYEAIEKLRVAEAVDVHFGGVQEHLSSREGLAATVSALFMPPSLSTPRPFRDYGHQVTLLAPEISTVGWLPEVEPAQADEVLRALTEAGVASPRFTGPGGSNIIPQIVGRPIYPIVDIAPDRNRKVLGVDAGSFPDRLAAIRQARDTRKVARTSPVRLVQSPDDDSILLYGPVFTRDGKFLGVIGFGYKVEALFEAALMNPKTQRINFTISVQTENVTTPLYVMNGGNAAQVAAESGSQGTEMVRSMTLGGRTLTFIYSMPRNLAEEAFRRGLWTFFAGLAFTGAAVSFLALIANRAGALSREVNSRRSAEERLKVLIHELNHRVRNVMSVAQAVVRLSFTSGSSLADVQKTCEGRLQALANAMSLLTASDWKSVNFRSLITDEILPFSERINTSGPDIALKARSAQTFALLLHELATNAAKHGAFSVPGGKVMLKWTIDEFGKEPLFRLTWQEIGGPVVVAPAHRGFGELLVRRIAPRDVSGRGKVTYAASGFEYEIEAPLRELIDPTAADAAT